MNVNEKTVANLWVLGIRKLNNCNIHPDASKFQPYCAKALRALQPPLPFKLRPSVIYYGEAREETALGGRNA